jgi:hypothetical protein
MSMDLLGFKKLRAMKQDWDNIIERGQQDRNCVHQGWRPYIGEPSNEKTMQAIRDILDGRDYTLYPPGYVEPVLDPVITEGKLQVDPEPPRRGWFW